MAKTAAPNTSTTNFTPTHDEIAAQAYQIYLREGCREGCDLDHWLRAEAELRERSTANGNWNGVHNGNGTSAVESANRAAKQQEQSAILPNSATSANAPIAQVNRGTTPKRSSIKREAAATAK